MAAKGQFKKPVLPLDESVAMAVRAINRHIDGVAIFMVGGAVKVVRSSASCFESKVAKLSPNLVGVYDYNYDRRSLRADLAVFYQ